MCALPVCQPSQNVVESFELRAFLRKKKNVVQAKECILKMMFSFFHLDLNSINANVVCAPLQNYVFLILLHNFAKK